MHVVNRDYSSSLQGDYSGAKAQVLKGRSIQKLLEKNNYSLKTSHSIARSSNERSSASEYEDGAQHATQQPACQASDLG